MSVQLRIDACSKYDHCKVCTSSKKNKRHQSNSVPGCPDAERFKCKFCSGDAALRHCTLWCLRKAAGGGQSSNFGRGGSRGGGRGTGNAGRGRGRQEFWNMNCFKRQCQFWSQLTTSASSSHLSTQNFTISSRSLHSLSPPFFITIIFLLFMVNTFPLWDFPKKKNSITLFILSATLFLSYLHHSRKFWCASWAIIPLKWSVK